ncbi:unannotated protein [freshwater metagenome]|uniref:Unannotated protein n=1 Tax=freshwater metagenome TaxID=449393 RepID=A0A6J7KJV7_9ZZZZ
MAFNSTSEAESEGIPCFPVVGTEIFFEVRAESLRIRSAATARSGVGNTGKLFFLKSTLASGANSCEPVRATTIGNSRIERTSPSAFAIRSTSEPTRTAKQATIESTPESRARTSRHFSKRSGEDITAAVTSTGLVIFP